MTNECQGWIHPRPIRIAFLVEDGSNGQEILDGIFADCYSRWGGRFSLVVPCVNQQIVPEFWPWLEAFDADVIYSYVNLDQASILEIHDRLYPSECLFHEFTHSERDDIFAFKPRYQFEALRSLSTLFTMSRRRDINAGPIGILDVWYGEELSRSFSDNFGTYLNSYGTSQIPTDAPGMQLLPIVSPENATRRNGFPGGLKTFDTELEAIKAFTDHKTSCLSLASTWLANRLQVRVYGWSDYFNLVIGDSFDDRLLFWNARLLIPAWLDQNLACYRIPPTELEKEDVFASLVELLRRRNRVNNGSGGQPQVKVRSTSLDQDQLDAICQKLRDAKVWGHAATEHISSISEIVPPSDKLSKAWAGLPSEGFSSRKVGWISFDWSFPEARPPNVVPDHLNDAPIDQHFTRGWWMSDILLDYHEYGPDFGLENSWELSRRWRMAEAFGVERSENGGMYIFPRNRTSRGGRLAVAANAAATIERIKVPDRASAFAYALVVDGRHHLEDPNAVRPRARAYECEDSNESRYLSGVLDMAGGLESAQKFLLHPYLYKLFSTLGANPDSSQHDKTPLLNRLKKRALTEKTFDLGTDEGKEFLSAVIIREAMRLKKSASYIAFSTLDADWTSHRDKFWSQQKRQAKPEEDAYWDESERASLTRTLEALRRRKMLFQGISWTCEHCAHRNWVDLAALSTELRCEVCRRETPAPVMTDWKFRANEFLIESLRDHSTLSLIWTLGAFSRRARRSLIYLGPTRLYWNKEDTSGQEVDLVVLADGKSFAVEVKNSWQNVSPSEISKLVDVAKKLRPDVAMLSVMESGRKKKKALENAAQELADAGIHFELLTLDQMPLTDNPHLPG